MLIWAGYRVSKYIEGISTENIQPNGVDLTLSEVYIPEDVGFLGKNDRFIPEYQPIEPQNNKWHLSPGSYVIRYGEYIKIPENAVGLVLPRSSLLRMGATIYTALWDAGYEGRGIGLLVVFNEKGIIIERGARIAQIIYISAEKGGLYQGIWKGEGRD